MKIKFKLLEIASNIFSKSNQLKDLFLKSLTQGFNLKINIFESISNNLSYAINYKGSSQKIKMCLIKGKICIGTGDIIISNKIQKIEIYPENHKNLSKKIILAILCSNPQKNINDNCIMRSERTSSNTNNFNNCNTNNTSTLSISSVVNPVIQNKIKIPLNKIKNNRNKYYYRNNSQSYLIDKSQNKKLYIGLRQKNIYMHDKINNNNTTLFSERNKKHSSGNISLNSYFSENIKKNKKKIFSPKISVYSHPFNKGGLNNLNNKKRIKNNSMIISNEKNKNFKKTFKFSNEINIDKLNRQIENFIIDKSFEDELQKDPPIIYPQKKDKLLNNEDFNWNKFEQLLNDFLLLYNNDNIKNLDLNEIGLEFHFLIEKVYELIYEYYIEYYFLSKQNDSLINNIKYFGTEINNFLKLRSLLEKKNNKINLKNIFFENKNKDDEYFSKNIKKLKNELDILKNMNLSLINKNLQKESSKKLLKNIFVNIINKNKSYLAENHISKIKQINIKIYNNEISQLNKNKNQYINNINKKAINYNIFHKYKNSKNRTNLDNKNKKMKNHKIKERSNNKIFDNNGYKIKVKTKYLNL